MVKHMNSWVFMLFFLIFFEGEGGEGGIILQNISVYEMEVISMLF